MTSRLEFLDLDDLLSVAEAILGSGLQVRDYGLLEAALARPVATVYAQDAYPSLVEVAAALLLSLVNNHALVDGNTRLGWICCLLFLSMNDVELRVDPDADTAFVLAIADGVRTDVRDVASEIAARIDPQAGADRRWQAEPSP